VAHGPRSKRPGREMLCRRRSRAPQEQPAAIISRSPALASMASDVRFLGLGCSECVCVCGRDAVAVSAVV